MIARIFLSQLLVLVLWPLMPFTPTQASVASTRTDTVWFPSKDDLPERPPPVACKLFRSTAKQTPFPQGIPPEEYATVSESSSAPLGRDVAIACPSPWAGTSCYPISSLISWFLFFISCWKFRLSTIAEIIAISASIGFHAAVVRWYDHRPHTTPRHSDEHVDRERAIDSQPSGGFHLHAFLQQPLCSPGHSQGIFASNTTKRGEGMTGAGLMGVVIPLPTVAQ